MNQRADMPTGHREAAQHGPDHNDDANDYEHGKANLQSDAEIK